MPSAREVISYSELVTFRDCPMKHQLAYIQRWKKLETSPALSRGTGWHSAMAAHYEVIRDHQATIGEVRSLTIAEAQALRPRCDRAAQIAIRDSGLPDNERELLLWMYQGYVEMWGVDRDWWVDRIEYGEPVVLPNPDGKRSKFMLKTKLDLVVRDLSLPGWPLKIVDHKSGANLPSDKELDLDDQFGLYQLALREAGWPVIGTVYNAARTTRNLGDHPGADAKNKPQPLEKRFLRYGMTRSDPELTAIGADAYRAAVASRSKANLAAPYASPNPDVCKWKCDFVTQHIAARKIGVPVEDILSRGGFVQDYTRH